MAGRQLLAVLVVVCAFLAGAVAAESFGWWDIQPVSTGTRTGVSTGPAVNP